MSKALYNILKHASSLWWVVNPVTQSPKPEDHPLSALHTCIQYTCNYPSYLDAAASIHNLRTPCCGYKEPLQLLIAVCVMWAQHHQPWQKLVITNNGFIVWNVCILHLSTTKNRILCGVIRMIFWWNLQYWWNRLQVTVNTVADHLCYLEWYNRIYHYLIMEHNISLFNNGFLIFTFITYS